MWNLGFPGGSHGKDSAFSAGDLASIPGLRRSPGEGNGNPLWYSCLENSMDRGAWWAVCFMGSQRVGHDRATNTHTYIGNLGAFPGGTSGKEPACDAGNLGEVVLIAGLGRSLREGNGNPLQYSCMEIPHGQRSVVGSSP